MNANTEVTLEQVHAAIVAAIGAQFPDLHVEAYRQDRKLLPVPACMVELTEMQGAPELDPGTEQLAVTATFEAQLVMPFRQAGKNPRLEVRKLAAAVAAFAHLNRWGCPIGPAEVTGAFPDDFEAELDQFEVWRVEWQQVIHLGNTVWTDTGTQPSVVLVSHAPLIGLPYQDEYEQVNSQPDEGPTP